MVNGLRVCPPITRVKIHEIGIRELQVRKTPFPTTLEKCVGSQKIPVLPAEPRIELEIFDSRLLVWKDGKWSEQCFGVDPQRDFDFFVVLCPVQPLFGLSQKWGEMGSLTTKLEIRTAIECPKKPRKDSQSPQKL